MAIFGEAIYVLQCISLYYLKIMLVCYDPDFTTKSNHITSKHNIIHTIFCDIDNIG